MASATASDAASNSRDNKNDFFSNWKDAFKFDVRRWYRVCLKRDLILLAVVVTILVFTMWVVWFDSTQTATRHAIYWKPLNATGQVERDVVDEADDIIMDPLRDALPYVEFKVHDIVMIAGAILTIGRGFFHPQRFTITRRWMLLYVTTMFARDIGLLLTIYPDSSATPDSFRPREVPKGCALKDPASSFVAGSPMETCGDMMFSGHTVMMMMMAFVWHHYTNIVWLKVVVWLSTALGVFWLIVAHVHWTDDVYLAVLINVMMWQSFHCLLEVKELRTVFPRIFFVVAYLTEDRSLDLKWEDGKVTMEGAMTEIRV